MTTNDPKNQEEQPEEQPLTPQSPPEKPESDEVSLLDLMNADPTPPAGSEPVSQEASTAVPLLPTTPPIDDVTDDLPPIDDATLTDVFPAETPSARKPTPLPLTPDELKPQERPLVHDPDATNVQPRAAFSQQRKPVKPESDVPTKGVPVPTKGVPIEDAPTQVHRPVRPSPPPDEDATILHQRVVRPRKPAPEQPKRETPKQKRPVRQQPLRERDVQQRQPSQPKREQPVRQQPVRQQPVRQQPSRVAMPKKPPKRQPKPQTRRKQKWRGCLVRGIMLTLVVGIVGVVLVTAGLAIGYKSIANDLPDPSDILTEVSTFETAVILDRNGNTLYSLAHPDIGNRTRVSLDEISLDLRNATIATEDSRFYENPGFDIIG
ncbi:MAG: hypothetical protein GY943_34555, partial [Chloroflexi bacterium]|nr:hypothetical protein [Chloroflexota bacterium]